jgi:solute carrier family 10 (sodium/bile acid cotransporter), member 7
MRRFLPDGFVTSLLIAAALASLFPADGDFRAAIDLVVQAAIVTLFFFHGLRLSREAVISGFGHWRLHLTILAMTFALYPLAGLGLSLTLPDALPAPLWVGILFLACVPSTVQSSISLISIAKGNVPAAVAQAAASNLAGILLTPLAASFLIAVQGSELPLSGIWKIAGQLLLPFAIGHIVRPWLFRYAEPHLKRLALLDKAVIVLVVYAAFSTATREGIWQKLDVSTILIVAAICFALLLLGMGMTRLLAKATGFNRPDSLTLFHAGTLKSLATGVPMAQILIAPAQLGMVIIPLMIFHQLQLITCTWIANRQGAESS